jgi:phosphoribosylpyrophosphate synthetase
VDRNDAEWVGDNRSEPSSKIVDGSVVFIQLFLFWINSQIQDQLSVMSVPASSSKIFTPANDRYNTPVKIVTLGHYYPRTRIQAARNLVKEASPSLYRADSYRADSSYNSSLVGDHIAWTRLINALNNERQWPQKRLYALVDAMLEPSIVIVAVPPHRAYQAFWPLRTLAQKLAEHGRIDGTSCLVRQTTIRRIIYGGPSSRSLHRQTIHVEDEAIVQGQRVLLLDDIAKSGASLVAYREMLQEAGAATVQAVALGRVIVDVRE